MLLYFPGILELPTTCSIFDVCTLCISLHPQVLKVIFVLLRLYLRKGLHRFMNVWGFNLTATYIYTLISFIIFLANLSHTVISEVFC